MENEMVTLTRGSYDGFKALENKLKEFEKDAVCEFKEGVIYHGWGDQEDKCTFEYKGVDDILAEAQRVIKERDGKIKELELELGNAKCAYYEELDRPLTKQERKTKRTHKRGEYSE